MFPLTGTSVWNDTKKYRILAESLVVVLHAFPRFVGTHLLVSSRHGGDVATASRGPKSSEVVWWTVCDGSNKTMILPRSEDLGYWQVGIRAIRINGEVCLGSFGSPVARSRRQNFTTSEAWGVHRWHLQRRPGYRHLTFGCARSVWQGHRSVRYNARYNSINSLFVSPWVLASPCPYLPIVSFANMIIWWPVHLLHIDLVGVWAEIADGCGRSIGLPQCRCSAARDWVVGGQSCMAELCWTLQGWICNDLLTFWNLLSVRDWKRAKNCQTFFWLLWVALIHWLPSLKIFETHSPSGANSKFQWLQSPGPKVITLYPFNYMRRLPLRDGITVGSSEGGDEQDFQTTWLRSCVHIHDVFNIWKFH